MFRLGVKSTRGVNVPTDIGRPQEMIKTHYVVVVASTCVTMTTAMADLQIDLGCFANMNPVPNCSYEGSYQEYVTSWEVDGYTSSSGYTMIDLDLSGILATLSNERIASITIMDFGSNTYGPYSPGADIDYVGFLGLSDDVEVGLTYSGPTLDHVDESEQDLLQRIDSRLASCHLRTFIVSIDFQRFSEILIDFHRFS